MKIELENKVSVVGVIIGIIIFFTCSAILPFPYGLFLGIIFAGVIIWYTRRQSFAKENSLLSYRRIDPKNDDEKIQNKEARRILEKKFLEEKITKEEYEKMIKEFNDEN